MHLEQHFLGRFPVLRLSHPHTGEYVEVLPTRGGTIQQIGLRFPDGNIHKVLVPMRTERELEKQRWAKGAQLAPWPNRISKARYVFAGQEHRPVKNFIPQGGHAIHGTVMEETFAASTALDEQGRLSLSLEREGWAGYPFPLRMEIRLSLSEGFAMEITLENTGTQACPVGHGWHPYFTLGNSVTECDLSVPAGKRLMMGPTAVPTGERSDWPRFKQAERIGDDFLDACLELQASEGTVSTRLTNPHNARSLDVWQDVGAGKYGYLQVFTHPLRHGLALEPMTCAPDAFNNGYGLVVLQPGEKLTTRCGVRAF